MRKVAALALLLGAVFGARGLAASPAAAQQPITVVSEAPQDDFPVGVTFAISFNAPAGVKEARLNYLVAPDGTGAAAIADCTNGAVISCSYELKSGAGIVIIPGAVITYHWELTDGADNKLSTKPETYVHQDTRFTFKTLTKDNITLYYHAGSDSAAQTVLDTADQTITTMSALEQTQLTFPVKVFLYSTAEEMQPAIAPGGLGRGVQVLGEVVYSDTAMVSADVDTLVITRHEVTHIVTAQATKGPFPISSWLNEGISVYAQGQPLSGQGSALQSAISSDTVLSMNDLSSSATGSLGATVDLFYGESGAIVKYLIDTNGGAKLALLLKTFKSGSTVANAFETAYGVDQFGIENQWRQSVGLQPRTPAPTPAPTATSSAAAAPSSATSGTPASSGSSGSNTTAVAIIVALIVLVIVAAGAAIVVVRRRG